MELGAVGDGMPWQAPLPPDPSPPADHVCPSGRILQAGGEGSKTAVRRENMHCPDEPKINGCEVCRKGRSEAEVI